MAETWSSRRRGIPKSITLDHEAAAFLVEMAPERTQGRYVSLLLLAERARREERQRLTAGIEQGAEASAP